MELTVDQMLQQGVAAHNAGNPQEAERLYRAILQVQPKHPDANHNLGLLAVSMDQPGVALPLFKSAIDVNPNIEQFWLSYIEALIAERQFEKAKQALKKGKKKGVSKEKLKALTQKLVSVKAGNNLIQAPSQVEMQTLINHYQNGQYGDAEKLAISITEQFPGHQFGWKVIGALLEKTGRKSEALNANQKAVHLEPEDAEAHYNLGNTFMGLGRLEEAEASYKQTIALKPDFVLALSNLGLTLQALGRLEEAEASYRQAIAMKPDYAEAHSNLGNTLKELGILEESEASYRQAVALKPNYAEAHSNLGVTLQTLGRLEEAEASYRQAIALEPNYAEAHSNLGATLKELGRLEEAEASYRQAVALKPNSAGVHSNLGVTLTELGRLKEAEASCRQAIALEPNYAEAHSNLGATLKELGKLEEAEASYKQTIALKPDYVEAHNNLGITLRELGRLEEAEASYRQAIALKPDYAEAHSNLGNTLKDLGRLEEAEASYRQAIALKPDYAEAHNNMGITLQELGRLEEAEASVRQAISLKPDFDEAKLNISRLLLNRQEFQLGWSLYDPPRNSKFEATPAYFTKRAERWKGSSLRGKNIQVYAAQGVGDEIMFSSCIPDLIQESPSKIYLDCDLRLEPLFARSFPEVTVYGRARTRRFSQTFNNTDILIEDVHFDYSLPIDGLPRFFRNKIEDFPNRGAFLVPDPASVDKWGKRLADLGEGLKIGISWLGGASTIHKKTPFH